MPNQFVSWWQGLTGFDKVALGFFVVTLLSWGAADHLTQLRFLNRTIPKFVTLMALVVLGLLVLFAARLVIGV